MELDEIQKALLEALYHAEAEDKNPEGVYRILVSQGHIISIAQVCVLFIHLEDRGYIYSMYVTTSLADREIGTEK
ncbi:hypothetical protein A2415_01225 [candidate division WWE3 bacterium RIFOXYC1_FULL_39_7]|uniref:Uncharacterized protein n=1 Tax=candidate division WWE3 bacterium RIFOXYC1_FULL_39_7 TaxID=1802643 RepID=A0A1F4WLY4_UNCKA|nr:MAG: hypothetical protein A2415_01225 [candidate division WWE3 bacterium RIFOXYC1_FULL_39_7]